MERTMQVDYPPGFFERVVSFKSEKSELLLLDELKKSNFEKEVGSSIDGKIAIKCLKGSRRVVFVPSPGWNTKDTIMQKKRELKLEIDPLATLRSVIAEPELLRFGRLVDYFFWRRDSYALVYAIYDGVPRITLIRHELMQDKMYKNIFIPGTLR